MDHHQQRHIPSQCASLIRCGSSPSACKSISCLCPCLLIHRVAAVLFQWHATSKGVRVKRIRDHRSMHFPSTQLAVMDIIRCKHAIQNSDQVTCTWGANELALVSFAIGKEQPPPSTRQNHRDRGCRPPSTDRVTTAALPACRWIA